MEPTKKDEGCPRLFVLFFVVALAVVFAIMFAVEVSFVHFIKLYWGNRGQPCFFIFPSLL
ncbi:hypothetical protein COU05_00025 [bacterium (Candidatus Gribaldobacteria) CG10_big_fil_rev_8_21_14_0_10_37_21]|uniref:Uncharacterized protein n=1 Tax=bacterium (Candidatus Gribaldobacteria) CG10_big_fil_rev_8_21_14_0_10_37_21 TaxID=2014275 RepID=A0A2H0UX90_9BACT|nr:MAG: hypothetical protein AUJ25_01750 [Parcubacteria group bacterium CG1_02_37_13]PIR90799.1 MAG: hypothetical protein COU05_00025 [bacterium (Candidatus Gribaldobacteria) CG10_big_fil_rev_8_21_14_0_10_37_21]